jgi:hypothetical protein
VLNIEVVGVVEDCADCVRVDCGIDAGGCVTITSIWGDGDGVQRNWGLICNRSHICSGTALSFAEV